MTMQRIASVAIGFVVVITSWGCAAAEKKILVYTRQGMTVEGKPGFIHDNTAAAVTALRKLATENELKVDVSDDPAVFTAANLKQYAALIFPSTNNQIFDTESQRAAFQNYIRGGGGLVGIHSATGSMRNWDWFCAMIGGRFQRHPKLQPFTIKVVDRNHPSTAFLPETWKWEDEFYYHTKMGSNLRVLLAGDLATVEDKDTPKTADNTYPLAWCQEFEGGRVWYTALGHKPQHYSDPLFVKHLLGGIQWAARIKD